MKHRLILLRDFDVVCAEFQPVNMLRARFMGWIWRYVPDLTYRGRRFMIVDDTGHPNATERFIEAGGDMRDFYVAAAQATAGGDGAFEVTVGGKVFRFISQRPA